MKKTNQGNQPTGLYAAVKALMLVLFFTFSGTTLTTANAAEKTNITAQTEARVAAIKDRVAEIQAMNLKTLSKKERSDLKAELKAMNHELRHSPTYIYISGAGLLLIIILLIILL